MDRLPLPGAGGKPGRGTSSFLARLRSLGRRGFPFQPLQPADPAMATLRAAAREALLSEHPQPVRAMLRLAAGLCWPIGALTETVAALRATPPADRPRDLPSWVGRAADILAMALLRNVPPRDYLMFRFHAPDIRAQADCFLFRTDLGLLNALNRLGGADRADVRDKARFAALCREGGFPAIPTLAAYRHGRQIEPETHFVPKVPRLWVKDLAGSRGSGAAQWDRDGGVYRNAMTGAALTPEQLVEDWRRRDCIVQPRLDNSVSLAGLSDGPLIDLRVITGLDPDGRPHLVAAYALLPCTDPAGRRWFVLGEVGSDGGRLIRVTLAGLQPLNEHPNTGASLKEICIADWTRCRDLTLAAHASVFPRFAFLGWDVAPTSDGPVLVEANDGWDLVAPQLALGLPLGRTPFAPLATARLTRPRCA